MVTIPVSSDIVLRSYNTEDAEALFAAVNNSRKHLSPWLNWVSKTTKPEQSLEFIRNAQRDAHDQRGLALGIFYNNAVAGGIGMLQWDHDVKKAQVGYWIACEYEGKGIVSQSLLCFLQFLFEKLNLNKIELQYVAANKRSARVAERMGFKIEGVLRQSFIRNGIVEDLVITGLLKSEWKQR